MNGSAITRPLLSIGEDLEMKIIGKAIATRGSNFTEEMLQKFCSAKAKAAGACILKLKSEGKIPNRQNVSVELRCGPHAYLYTDGFSEDSASSIESYLEELELDGMGCDYERHLFQFAERRRLIEGGYEQIKRAENLHEHIDCIGPQSDIYHPAWDNAPPEVKPIVRLNGEPIASEGGMVVLIGPNGGGKTSVIGALCAARLNPNSDSLGLSVDTQKSMVVLDTEQSKWKHHKCWLGSMARAGLNPGDDCSAIRFDWLTPLGSVEAKKAHLQQVFNEGHGIIVVDGIADFLLDVNDTEAATELTNWLNAEAARTGVVLILIMHHNPTAKDDFKKARGVLGSELMRKAVAVVLLKKVKDDSGKDYRCLTMDFSLSKNRDGAEDMTSWFSWSDEHDMFRTCEPPENTEKNPKLNKYRSYADALSTIETIWKYADLKRAIVEKGFAKTERAAEALIGRMASCAVIKKDEMTGFWNTTSW